MPVVDILILFLVHQMNMPICTCRLHIVTLVVLVDHSLDFVVRLVVLVVHILAQALVPQTQPPNNQKKHPKTTFLTDQQAKSQTLNLTTHIQNGVVGQKNRSATVFLKNCHKLMKEKVLQNVNTQSRHTRSVLFKKNRSATVFFEELPNFDVRKGVARFPNSK